VSAGAHLLVPEDTSTQSGIARVCTACQGHCRVLRNRGLLSSVFAQQASIKAIWWWMIGGSREGLAN